MKYVFFLTFFPGHTFVERGRYEHVQQSVSRVGMGHLL